MKSPNQPHPKAWNWESYEWKGEYYYTRISTFKGPMWLFHVLRKLALAFDHTGNRVRGLIRKMSNEWEADFETMVKERDYGK